MKKLLLTFLFVVLAVPQTSADEARAFHEFMPPWHGIMSNRLKSAALPS